MMGSHHNIMLGREEVQVLAVCDVDRRRRERAQAQTERAYEAKKASGAYKGCDAYGGATSRLIDGATLMRR